MSKKISAFGVEINNITMSDALNFSKKILFGREDRKITIFTPNIEMLEAARRSPVRQKLLNSADLLLPDGTGVALIARLLGTPLSEELTGIGFAEALLQETKKERPPVFLLGALEGVAQRAKDRLRRQGVNVCGCHHGYFSKDELQSVIQAIDQSRAEILAVCMGHPLQERFALKCRDLLPRVKLTVCLGGALDVWSGDLVRAPIPLQQIHAEWLWRIALQPERAKRFVSSLPAIAAAASWPLKNISSNGLISKIKAYDITERI